MLRAEQEPADQHSEHRADMGDDRQQNAQCEEHHHVLQHVPGLGVD
jgi:hypothetical protein